MRLYSISLGLVLTSPEGTKYIKDGSIPSTKALNGVKDGSIPSTKALNG